MKRVILAGLVGGLVMIVWLVVADGILGLRRGIDMTQVPHERAVYGFLVEHVTEPGRYVVNPEVIPGQGFPGGDPIFAVHYTGLGHDDAGQEMLTGLVVALLSCVAGAWLLANSSARIQSRYGSRVLYFSVIGLVMALFGVGARFGLAAYPMDSALALGGHDLAAWVLAGLVVASLVKPAAEGGAARVG